MAEKEASPPAATTEEESPETPNALFKDLSILPPLQSYGGTTEGAVPLPPLRAEEPVASLRAALSEVRGYAHLTNFRFILEQAKGEAPPGTSPDAQVGSDPSQVVSPFTGPEAVVSAPAAAKGLGQNSNEAEIVLDDFDDLSPLIEKGLQDGAAFRVVLERYDAATVRDHVARLRSLLDGNAPSVVSLAEDAASVDPKEEPQKEPDNTEKAKKEAAEKLPKFPLGKSAAVDGTNLRDFFYLSCGEEQMLWGDADDGANPEGATEVKKKKSKKKKKKGKKTDGGDNEDNSDKEAPPPEQKTTRDICEELNEAEQKSVVKCTIRYSGFHPPPTSRRLMGDIAYFEVRTPGYPSEPVINVTAIATGFYVNKTQKVDTDMKFNPSPAEVPCFSHELLDCLLQKSKSLRSAWAGALNASMARANITATLDDTPLQSLHRAATRSDWGGCGSASLHPSHGIDSVIGRPTWLLPLPRGSDWNHNDLNEYNPMKAEEDLSNMFGLDLRGASIRDWNEELQSARELPTTDLMERIDRARLIHKVLIEFGEAAVAGTKAIVDGHVAPMNPNEPTRSHVYLHNNIFFSRAVDAGVETFKLTQGDRAARKAASRDAQCMGVLHRMDAEGLHTLATVLVDYLGTRFVCQSIVPGILHGEKTHTLLYGAVESTSPMAWDEEMHKLLEDRIGRALMVATRTIPKMPLSDERITEIEESRTLPILSETQELAEGDRSETNLVCGPIEAKGIRGSDQRTYVLDLSRLTPRDANWVPQDKGGTGKWESAQNSLSNGKTKSFVPESLDDDEWTTATLRQELVTNWTHRNMANYMKKKKKDEDSKEAESDEKSKKQEPDETSDQKRSQESTSSQETANGIGKDEAEPPTKKLTVEEEEYLMSLRLNLNVFLPHLRSLDGIDDEAASQLKLDETQAREIADYLWEEVLPKLTMEIRESPGHHLPTDGKSLTDTIQQRGINCRYLGRLAALALLEEKSDREVLKNVKAGKLKQAPRRTMPLSWLEILECEMVARAAKHVLDGYLTENGGAAAGQPAQTVASFLSAIVSEAEETAGDTERRTETEQKLDPEFVDEDDFNALAMFDTGGKGDAVPPPVRSRAQVWEDIQSEVGRRFRYDLTLYNNPGSGGRSLYIPLLRRVCQRNGVRLVAKNYDVGGKCLCTGGNTTGGRITHSYPVSPLDVLDVVPLVKHAAAQGGEGFVPFHTRPSVGPPSLHILLPDAKATLEAAHLHFNAHALPKALELAQEAINLYQRVTDTPLHSMVARCLDLIAAILMEANEPHLSAANAARSLGLVVQLGGFDCSEALTAHTSLSHIMFKSGAYADGVKHFRAAMYLTELAGGPRREELCNAYHKLASMYHEVGDKSRAFRLYEEASTRPSCDRLMDGMTSKNTSLVLAAMGQYKAAVSFEKRAYQQFAVLFGEEHELTKNSAANLKKLMTLAVDQGTRKVDEDKKRLEAAAADAIASQIEAAEAEKEEKMKTRKKKQGGTTRRR